MAAPDLVGVFVRPLEALGIPYMVTGGVAAVIYGDPRFTRDINIVTLVKYRSHVVAPTIARRLIRRLELA